MTNIIIPERFRENRLIPLRDYRKTPYDKWSTDEAIPFKGNETGYGIDTGRSNLIVIDCDVKNEGENGLDAYLDMVQEHEGDYPNTYSVETPSGGMHFYYQAPPGSEIRNSIGDLAKGIDVRAIGGMIIGADTLIQDDQGNVYQYKAMDPDAPIAELPNWLGEKLNQVAPKRKQLKNNPSDEDSKQGVLHAAEEIEQKNALLWALDNMSSSGEGSRNDTLNHTAYFLGRKRVERSKAEELISIAMVNGLTEQEAQRTFERAYEDGLKEPDIPSFGAITKMYNTKMNRSFKDDPMDTEFYSQFSMSYNFWKKHNHELLYWMVNKKWYRYNADKGIWKEIAEELVRSMMKEFMENLVEEIRTSKGSKLPSTVYKAHERLWTKAMVDATTAVARSDFKEEEEDLFEEKPHIINCKNGVVNLKTGEIEAHSAKHHIRRYIPVDANLDATDKYCNMVIEAIHPDARDYMQVIAGQSLSDFQPYNQTLHFLLGNGANGKSTFLTLMEKTSGDYARLQPPSVLMQDKSGKENYALADFEDIRLGIIEELPDSKVLDTGAAKRLIGSTKINSRRIYAGHTTFFNTSTVMVSCNKLPMVNENDYGTWRRLVVISFPYSYKKSEKDVKNPARDRVSDSKVLLSANRSASTAEAFLAWRLKGAIKWMSDETVEDVLPPSTEAIVQEWHENNDLFLAWFNECMEKKVNHYVLLQDAFESFNEFVMKRGNAKVSQRYFLANLKGHELMSDNQISYLAKTRVSDYTHSPRTQEDGTVLQPADRSSFFLNMAFSD